MLQSRTPAVFFLPRGLLPFEKGRETAAGKIFKNLRWL